MEHFSFFASVIGYGRFGRLWTSLLSKYIHSTDKKDILKAIGIVDMHSLSGMQLPQYVSELSIEEAVQKSETIFLCVPISHIKQVLKQITHIVHPHALVCDTCSVKMMPIAWMQEILSHDQPIMATHPLFGPDSYPAVDYCDDSHACIKNYTIITNAVRINKKKYEDWKNIFATMHMRSIDLTPDEHDHKIAYSQYLTHLLGRTLKMMELTQDNISTKGYEALLKIVDQTCNDTTTLFEDMHTYNSFAQKVELDVLNNLKKCIDTLSHKK